MDPVTRTWWKLLEDLPGHLTSVIRWLEQDEPATAFAGEIHANPTVVACLQGVVRVVRPRGNLDLHPGDVVLIAPGAIHRHEPLRGASVSFGQGFLPSWSDVIFHSRDRHWYGHLPSDPSRHLLDTAMATQDDTARRQVVASLFDQILTESVEDMHFGHPAMLRMLKCLYSRCHTDLTTEDLLRSSLLSATHANRVFIAAYGCTPARAIAIARRWLAESLLKGGCDVATVARRCGYASVESFSRSWKRVHGTPPRETRIAHRHPLR
jgi:AraC-like DNA-binding protein